MISPTDKKCDVCGAEQGRCVTTTFCQQTRDERSVARSAVAPTSEADFLRRVRDVLCPTAGTIQPMTEEQRAALDMIGDRLIDFGRAPRSAIGRIEAAGCAAHFDLTPKQLADLCTFSFGMSCDAPEDAMEITIGYLEKHESGPGWYAWGTEYPEEGAVPINDPLHRSNHG
jgi:hypothetical protein